MTGRELYDLRSRYMITSHSRRGAAGTGFAAELKKLGISRATAYRRIAAYEQSRVLLDDVVAATENPLSNSIWADFVGPDAKPEPAPPEPPLKMDINPHALINPARRAAYSREGTGVEELTLQEDLEYTAACQAREGRKASLDSYPAGVFDWESAHYANEQTARNTAIECMRRGYGILRAAITSGLSPDEVRALRGPR